MNDSEYKDYLNKFSSSFCGAKYYNATIWLGSGMTTSCHHPLPHKIPLEGLDENPSLIHNTDTKKQERGMMKRGERPSGCDYCWRMEDNDQSNISDRVYKSKIYTDQELQEAYDAPEDQDFDLRTLEISFDRTCNLACSYCNPAFSTTWVKDIKKNGAYQNLKSDGRNHFTHSHDSSQLYKIGEYNPYVDAFFKWWETDLHKTLRELRVTGGEPMMSPELWRLIDWFNENADKSQTKLAINSNLICKPELLQRLLDASDNLPQLDVYTSCEATKQQAEYIRDGLDYKEWCSNLFKLQRAGINTHVMCTINALCLETLPELINFIMFLRRGLSTKDFGVMSFNVLRFPSFQSCLVLPIELRQKFAAELETNIQHHEIVMHEFEVNQLKRLIRYLQTSPEPHNVELLKSDFRNFYDQYDQRRGKDFASTFPRISKQI